MHVIVRVPRWNIIIFNPSLSDGVCFTHRFIHVDVLFDFRALSVPKVGGDVANDLRFRCAAYTHL